MKVLIVDDDDALRSAMQSMVEYHKKHTVITAQDGSNGYAAYLRFRPDVVITDIEMPGKSGFEMMRAIRCHDPSVRTIYMSGDAASFRPLVEAEQRRYRVMFLGKPFSFDKLSELLAVGA